MTFYSTENALAVVGHGQRNRLAGYSSAFGWFGGP